MSKTQNKFFQQISKNPKSFFLENSKTACDFLLIKWEVKIEINVSITGWTRNITNIEIVVIQCFRKV